MLPGDDEMKFVMSSTHEELRDFLSIRPTNLEQAYALNHVVSNARQEFNQMCFGTITPSKITTKRRQSFLNPNNKKDNIVVRNNQEKIKHNFKGLGGFVQRKKAWKISWTDLLKDTRLWSNILPHTALVWTFDIM